MKRLFTSLLTLALFPLTILAQEGTLKGTVYDAVTKESLIGAYVLYDENKGTTTGIDGQYKVKLEYGTYTLRVSYVGYKPQTKKITIDGGVQEHNFMLKTESIGVADVVADVARERETPVAFANVLPAQINEEMASQDLPMILNSTPGVYATQQGGGDGDARITIRGFDQRNIAVMIDGVPVNDMENGWVYWSNWFGLDAVTRSIQVQRGLGASRLAIPSVGGTMNILTKGIDSKKGVTFKQEVGSFGFTRSTIGLTTGRMENGWGVTVAGSYKTGNGYGDRLFTEGYFYYLKVEKELGNHLISLSGMGAPQSHGQRSFKRPIANYSHEFAREQGVSESEIDRFPDYGILYNQHWGQYENRTYGPINNQGDHPFESGELRTLNERVNYYHKPQFTLRDLWTVNEDVYITNTAYLSLGNGGGTSLNSTSWPQTSSGQIDFQTLYDNNLLVDTFISPDGLNPGDEDGEIESENYLQSSINNHFWYGYIGNITYAPNDEWTLNFGVDGRSYKGEHYRTPYDLLGGDYVVDTNNKNRDPETKIREGDKFTYHDEGIVRWAGAYFQAEVKKLNWSAFINVSGAYSAYKAVDYFRPKTLQLYETVYMDGVQVSVPDTVLEVGYNNSVAYNGTTYDRNSDNLETYETDWISLHNYTIKGGANYNVSEFFNVYGNLGYLSKAPRFDNVIDRQNNVTDTYANEIIQAVEAGAAYKKERWNVTMNAYRTQWFNKPVNQNVQVEHPEPTGENDRALVFVPDMDALHMGVELQGAYLVTSKLTIEGLLSVGDWTWQSTEEGELVDQNTNLLIINDDTGEPYKIEFDPRGVHVGNAAQLQIGGLIRYDILDDFYVKVRSTFFGNQYADFNPESLVGEDAGRDSWKTPGYNLFDFHTGYRLDLPKDGHMDVRLSVLNILDSKYITDAQNNDQFTGVPQNFNAESAAVFFGAPRRFNLTLSITY
jgi:hypothetical protein